MLTQDPQIKLVEQKMIDHNPFLDGSTTARVKAPLIVSIKFDFMIDKYISYDVFYHLIHVACSTG